MATLREFPVLYKMSNTGKVSKWEICAINKNDTNRIMISFGYIDGIMQTQEIDIPEGKNIGRANETTAWEQCQAEALSKWTKQRDRKGYTEYIPTKRLNLLPMLAKSYDDQKDKLKFPCFAQPKLDGIRCLAYWDMRINNVVLISRQGKQFKALQHLEQQLYSFLKQHQNTILDGELYVHGESFQNIVSAIKRDTPSDVSHLIEYHVYDVADDESDYVVRHHFIETKVKQLGGNIKVVPTYTVSSEDNINNSWIKATDGGYEGIMLRNKLGLYKFDGRSSDLLKYKKFMDEEFEIVNAYENKGTQKDQCTLVCKTSNGIEFGVKPEGTASQRRKIWDDFQAGKLKGKFLTVRFFAWTTSANPVPRFPIGVIIRDYENE